MTRKNVKKSNWLIGIGLIIISLLFLIFLIMVIINTINNYRINKFCKKNFDNNIKYRTSHDLTGLEKGYVKCIEGNTQKIFEYNVTFLYKIDVLIGYI